MEHEIEHLMAYVKIQQSQSRYEMERNLICGLIWLRSMNYIPWKILLQPIVENSFSGTNGRTGQPSHGDPYDHPREKGGWVTIVLITEREWTKNAWRKYGPRYSGRKYEKGGAGKEPPKYGDRTEQCRNAYQTVFLDWIMRFPFTVRRARVLW